ncbi:MAG: hypothetical protein ACTJIB_10515 [Pseudoalteromonas prydzensis]|uniref:hypothetical protein n=1 Tax=Pseudoalteromonas prydzensis TaxID=182141 RepID=UPI003F9A6E56
MVITSTCKKRIFFMIIGFAIGSIVEVYFPYKNIVTMIEAFVRLGVVASAMILFSLGMFYDFIVYERQKSEVEIKYIPFLFGLSLCLTYVLIVFYHEI